MREKLLSVKINTMPDVKPRIQSPEDKNKIVKSKDDERVTLWEDKENYPYKLYNDIVITIETNIRKFSFKIKDGYTYDGATIPKLLHFLVGSNGEPKFLVPALLHDFILEKMYFIYHEVLKSDITIPQFRSLTTDIFKFELEYYGTKSVKSEIMAKCVQLWQCTGSKKQWNQLKKK